MNEHVIELVNGELDGTNSPSESAALVDILDKDPAARAFFEENKSLFAILGDVPEADPPVDLKDRIMESVEREARIGRVPSPGIAASIRSFFQPVLSRPAWAMSYAFVAGILIGVAALSLLNETNRGEGPVVQGTMGQATNRILDEASVMVGDIRVDLATVGLTKEQDVVLDVTISGSGDSTVSIAATNDSVAGTTITASGPGHFTVSLDQLDDLVVSVTSGGHETSVRLLTSPV